MPKPDVILGEHSRVGMLRGFESIGRLMALTLGPVGGNIANERDGTREIEILRDAATAARRIIELPDVAENPGAMLMRHIVWNVRQQVGDGSATAAVIAQALAREMTRVIAAGANAMIVKRGVERALDAAIEALDGLATPLEGEDRIAAVATAAIGDAEIGKLLGEIFDVLGPNANVVIVPYVATYHDRAYREGARFRGGYVSPYLLNDETRRMAVLEDVHVLVADMNFDTAESAANLLEQVMSVGGKALLLICKQCSDKAIGVFAANNDRKQIISTVANIKPVGDARRGMIENIATIVGGKPLHDKMGMGPEAITVHDMGRAERVVVEHEAFTIIGGKGDPAAVRERINSLRQRARTTPDLEERETMRELLTHFSEGVAELRVGALTSQERTALTEIAEQAIKAVNAGMESGVVPGGGSAYLSCIPAVRAIEATGDEAFGIEILARVLEEPMRRIAANSNVHPPLAVAEAQRLGEGHGLDARTGQVVDLVAEGIVDPAIVARRALLHGVSGALMLLTTDALVIHRKPKENTEP
jgi:chaperonin GroEL